jgi:hypothetical protein
MTLAGIDERSGDPVGAERTLTAVIDQARRDGDAHAEMRSRYLLAGLLHERGDLEQARLVAQIFEQRLNELSQDRDLRSAEAVQAQERFNLALDQVSVGYPRTVSGCR